MNALKKQTNRLVSDVFVRDTILKNKYGKRCEVNKFNDVLFSYEGTKGIYVSMRVRAIALKTVHFTEQSLLGAFKERIKPAPYHIYNLTWSVKLFLNKVGEGPFTFLFVLWLDLIWFDLTKFRFRFSLFLTYKNSNNISLLERLTGSLLPPLHAFYYILL